MTTYRFQYGTTRSYGKQTTGRSAGSGSSGRSVAQAINALKPNTIYHYRIVATNASGTAVGQDRTFRTTRGTARGPDCQGSVTQRATQTGAAGSQSTQQQRIAC
jgi:phosphodiesterase/alkaline phosphatase D-like protein